LPVEERNFVRAGSVWLPLEKPESSNSPARFKEDMKHSYLQFNQEDRKTRQPKLSRYGP